MPDKYQRFDDFLVELLQLNIKCLELLLTDLKSQYHVHSWSGDYHRMLQHSIELRILEGTVLK